MRRALLVISLAVLLSASTASAAGADPYRSLQWGLTTVEAPEAWAESRGEGAVVAVIDTGVDRAHPDLAGRTRKGYDFVDDDDDATDENGHGTLVAGIVAATVNNGVGVASVAPGSTILPVRVLDAAGSGKSDTVAEGVRWATAQRVDVINLSLANEQAEGTFGEVFRDPSVDDAIRDAARAGIAVIVAAGNSATGGRPETSYDATVPGVLVVGATTKGDDPAAYAHYGAGVDLVAPGGGSPDDPSDDACTAKNAIVSTWWNPSKESSEYGGGCGTSMAVGFVSGAAALLAAQGFSNRTIATRLLSTVDDLGPKGRDDRYGAGRLNVRRALGVPLRRLTSSSSASPKRSSSRPPGDVTIAGNPDQNVPDGSPSSAASRAPEASLDPIAAPLEGVASRGTPSTPAGVTLVVAMLAHVAHWRSRSGRARAG